MGGFDDHGGIIGDWIPPSPSPRAFFAAMLGDETGSQSRPEIPKYENNNDNGFTFRRPDRQIGSENSDVNQRGQMVNQVKKSGEFGEQKTGSRESLVERMAARAGHNAPRLNTDIMKPVDSLQNQQTWSPYLTIPPELSPTSFLESPVFLSNSLVQPSPTTGKFQFGLNGNGNGKSSMMFLDSFNRSKDNFLEEPNYASFAFKPFPDSAHDHVNPSPFISTQSFQSNEALIHSEKQFLPQKIEPTQTYSDFSIASNEKNLSLLNENVNQSQQHLEEHHDDNADQRINGDITITNPNANNSSSDDGYNWRKYGQKQVKGSEYPRSYYKCTHQNCPVKKKVELSHEGHITEIIYKGSHNHPKIALNRRSGIGSSSLVSDVQGDNSNNHWGQKSNIEVNSSGMVMNGPNGPNSGQCESSDVVDGSTTFSNDEEEDRVTHGSVSLGYDGEGDESESKRRKVEAYAADVSGATRAIREPRVVVQTTSEVDILDDGYRWRKYGQKVVKGNPNPRSYYKCTSMGCTVRKHVERASHDLKSVITTYEGKHNHDVPAARSSNHTSNNNNTMATQQALSMQPQVHLTNPSQMQNTMARFERPPYGLQLHNGQHMGPTPTHNYGYLMNHQGPGGLVHMGMDNHQGKLPVLHYLGQQQQQQQMQTKEMGLMVPKGEPKVEPMSDPGAPIYHQMINRLPLGP